MQGSEKWALSDLRIERAEECLSAAKQLVDSGNYRGVANRAYYCVFHGMRAVLALDGIDKKHHSGIMSEFRRLYVKPGIFTVEHSDIISNLADLRTDSDYDDLFVVVKAEVVTAVQDAEVFLKAIRAYLQGVPRP